MTKLKLLLTVVLAIAFSSSLYGQWTGDGDKGAIIGTPHDLYSGPLSSGGAEDPGWTTAAERQWEC